MKTIILTLLCLLAVSTQCFSQNVDSKSIAAARGSLGSPTTLVSGSGERSHISAPTTVMIRNRARMLGDSLSASRTRYFAVTDRDLAGLSDRQALARLTPPPVVLGDGVRSVAIALDVHRPITATMSAPVAYLGTVLVDPRLRDIEVVASVYLDHVTLVRASSARHP